MNVATGNKRIVQQFIDDIWNNNNLAKIENYWTPDCVNHVLPPSANRGLENLKASHQPFFEAFSNICIEILDQIAEGDKVVTHLVFRGKHTGEFFGVLSTTKSVEMRGIRIDRIQNGKIAEHWAVFDIADLMQQLNSYSQPAHQP